MTNIEPINQTKLFGLDKYLFELIKLYNDKNFPNKLLLSGLKGSGKSTLAFHIINYILSKNQEYSYQLNNFEINPMNQSFKTVVNKSNPNLLTLDVKNDKKFIDINQIRELLINLNKSSFNDKPRIVLIDNIDFLNVNSVNALLKVLEEPNDNVYFILINNNKKTLSTLLSRCINFRIYLTNKEVIQIAEKLLNKKINKTLNDDLINYYLTPGNLFRLVKFAEANDYNLLDYNLKSFLRILIKEKHYKKDLSMKYMIFDFIEFYFRKINSSISLSIFDKYSYFLKRKSDTKKYNLDEETFFMEFEEEILNG